MVELENLFTVPLVDMCCLGDVAFRGILIPEPDITKTRIGITEQLPSVKPKLITASTAIPLIFVG
jgi:hypothetical protein